MNMIDVKNDTEKIKMKRTLKYVLTVLGCVVLLAIFVFIIPLIINSLYLKNEGYITVWEGKDVLSFYGDVLAFIGTCALGVFSLYQNYVFKEANEKVQKEQEERARNEKRPIYQFEYSINEKNNVVLVPRKTPNTVGFNERVIKCKMLHDNIETEIFVTDWNNPFEFEFKIPKCCKFDANELCYMRMWISYTDMFNCTVHDTYWILLTGKRQCCAILEERKVYDKENEEIFK